MCGFDDDVRKKLNKYQLYIQPSYYESFCLAVAEAFNAGCYVIASDIGGMKEIVNYVGNGKLFKIGNYIELAYIIKSCYENRNIIRKNRKSAITKLENKFGISNMIRSLDVYYNKVR